MKLPAIASLGLTALVLGACSQQVPLAYVSTAQIAVNPQPAIHEVTATDQRGEGDPTRIGAVRGGFGNPLKVLHTRQPLADMVAQAFRDALAARGLLVPTTGGSADLIITIVRFGSSQLVRREAKVDLVLELRDRASGRQLYRDEVKSNHVQGSMIALDVGIFGSSDDLQAVAQAAMNDAIDAALNKPGFAAALRTASASRA